MTANSNVETSAVAGAATGARTVRFEIYRYDPDKDARPYMQTLDVRLQPNDKMLLDASHAVTIASRPRARIPSDSAGLRRCNIRRHLDPPARRASPLHQAERPAGADAARALHAA